MRRTQEDLEHEYLAFPPEYPISENEVHSTYDTFIKLRDTIIYSDKVYANNAGRSLIIWIKTSGEPTWTIEIRTPNIFNQGIEQTGPATPIIKWTYIKQHTNWAEIVLGGRYRITHKEQLEWLWDTQITRVTWYVLQKKLDGTEIKRAVFDWSWNTAWEIRRITSFWTTECDLEKWDILELHVVDQDDNDIPLSLRQPNSNRWTIEYLDLPYNI